MTPEEYAGALAKLGSQRAVCREHGLTRHRARMLEQGQPAPEPEKPVFKGNRDAVRAAPAQTGQRRRYILTAAQNNTEVHPEFWRNLQAYAAYGRIKTEILVAPFTYDKAGWSAHGGQTVKRMKKQGPIAWAPELEPFLVREDVRLAPDLIFCATMEINPTASDPLSGLLTYTGSCSAVIPHTKIALRSSPRMPGEPMKLTQTTGVVTMRNYIPRKTGLKASFHHAYAALLVEVDTDGTWFARHLNATDDGSFMDLNTRTFGGEVMLGYMTHAMIWGDLHEAQLDADAFNAAVAIAEHLQPEAHVYHDVLDQRAENHHERKNAFKVFEKEHSGVRDLRAELKRLGSTLTRLVENCNRHNEAEHYVAWANHDAALTRWLDEADFRQDPKNALLFLELQTERYQHAALGIKFHVLEHALRPYLDSTMRWLDEDSSLLLKGVECALHGHRGANGAKGTPRGFANLGRKTMTAHTHSPFILEGAYGVGTLSKLEMGYNAGLSSWVHGVGLIYENGKRVLLHIRNGKWKI